MVIKVLMQLLTMTSGVIVWECTKWIMNRYEIRRKDK